MASRTRIQSTEVDRSTVNCVTWPHIRVFTWGYPGALCNFGPCFLLDCSFREWMCGITCAVCPRREEEGNTTLRKDCSSYSKGSARTTVTAAQRFLALRVVEVKKPPVGFNKSWEFGLELRCYVPAVVFALGSGSYCP